MATKDSAKLGYYPGSKNEKLLDSQIGNLLSSKLGGRIEVERLMHEEQLILLPMSDIRAPFTPLPHSPASVPARRRLPLATCPTTGLVTVRASLSVA